MWLCTSRYTDNKSFAKLSALIFALSLAIITPLITLPSDWAGWFLMYLSYAVVLLNKTIRKEKPLVVAIWLTLLAHQFVALWDTYISTIIGGMPDVYAFHAHGVHIAEQGKLFFNLGVSVYHNLLASFYLLVGPSNFFGHELSIFAYALSCMVLVGFFELLNIRKYRSFLILLYGMLPTMVILGSFTLREPFQLLLFMLAVYLGLHSLIHARIGLFILSFFSALLMGLFHQVLLVYAIFLLLMIFFWPTKGTNIAAFSTRNRLFCFLLITGTTITGYLAIPYFGISGGKIILAVRPDNLIRYLVKYRYDIDKTGPRTSFDMDIDPTSWDSTAISIGLLYLHYMFAPFPWQAKILVDIYAALEALLRITLIALSVISLWQKNQTERRLSLLLFACYLSMTFLWSLGTTNFGQAIRHHLLTNWIIVLLGGPLLFDYLSSIGRLIHRNGTRDAASITPTRNIEDRSGIAP